MNEGCRRKSKRAAQRGEGGGGKKMKRREEYTKVNGRIRKRNIAKRRRDGGEVLRIGIKRGGEGLVKRAGGEGGEDGSVMVLESRIQGQRGREGRVWGTDRGRSAFG